MNTDKAHSPESIAQLAEGVFTDLHRTIINHESGSLNGDIESVHDMRVNVRRLRVALSNFAFCVPKADRKRIKLISENLASALGGVRDMDVMISAMRAKRIDRSDHEISAISTLIGKLRSRRRSRLKALISYLGSEEYAEFKREIPSKWIKIEDVGTGLRHQHKVAQISKITDDAGSQGVLEEKHGQAA